jgi:hypothetical protein
MLDFKSFRKQLYKINNEDFHNLVFKAFYFQAAHNPVYKAYIDNLNIDIAQISEIHQIPFLPISFFKSREVRSGHWQHERVFESSGTTGSIASRHFIDDFNFYLDHSQRNFELFYGNPSNYHLMALLPSYLERENSSLVHMVQRLMEAGGSSYSSTYLYNYDYLIKKLNYLKRNVGVGKIMLIGITFALLELATQKVLSLPKDAVVMETGGMKGRRKEMIREEFHAILRDQWQIDKVHSEYGMTELLSQAYSSGDGKFKTPPWMKVLVRDINDPFGYISGTGGINVIDLANIHSCAFIETQDIGKVNKDGSFEIMGRFDNSDIRGCSLLWN